MHPFVLSAIVLFSLLLSSCGSLPSNSTFPSKKIACAYGPEDIMIDSLSSPEARLLISCSSRRKGETDSLNGIYALNFNNDKVTALVREGEPSDLSFHPHGFHMVMLQEQAYLFVINHEDNINRQSILRYKIFTNRLVFDSMITHPYIISPNDIFVLKNGGFIISNDSKIRGNRWELLLGQKKGSILYYPSDGSPLFIDTHLGYPNGVYYCHNQLYVSTVSENTLYKYERLAENLNEKSRLVDGLDGGDNINPYGNGFLIASHPRFFKFFLHSKSSSNLSPSLVYYYDKNKNNLNLIYANDGSQISAASTAIIYHNTLYLSQVFDPFILKVDLSDKSF